MHRLALIALILLLAGCSAATRYTINLDFLSFVPVDQRTLAIPSGTALLLPGPEGQLVPLTRLDILERGQILVSARLTNTGGAPLRGSLQVRLAPEHDTNLGDNAGGDTGLDAGSFDVPAGGEQQISIDLVLSETQNREALNIIRGGSFRVAIRAEASGDGGRLALNQGRVSVTGRPFALVR